MPWQNSALDTRHMMSVQCGPSQHWQRQWHSGPLGNRAIVSGGNVFWTPVSDRLTLFSLEHDGISVDRPAGINWQTWCTANSNKTREPMKSIGIASLLQISCLDSKHQNQVLCTEIQFNLLYIKPKILSWRLSQGQSWLSYILMLKVSHGKACWSHHFHPALPG